MQLFSAAWDSLPSHRAEGLTASVTIHVTFLAFLTSLPGTATATEGTVAITTISRSDIAGAEAAGNAEVDSSIEESEPGSAFPESGLQLGGLAVDIEKIRRLRDTLFPFVTKPLPFLDEVPEQVAGNINRLGDPFGRERKGSRPPPLTLGLEQRQRLVDRAWARRARWQSFSQIAALLRKHDPDAGDAAPLVRAHLDQNLLQPYFDGATRDPRFWVMLGLAADHAPFIDFVADFMREHRSSRVTTELLFMLDEFAQASRDAMLMLLSTDPRTMLTDTFDADEDAYALAESVYRQYRDWARREGLHRTDDVRGRFDDVRIGILRTILAASPQGYGASDARYLLGLIYWDRNDRQSALRWWRQLSADGRDAYRDASAAIVDELSRAGGPSAAIINRILGAEYRRWLTFSEARLDHFGYAFDTF